jgi:hypothetical protein
MTNSSDAWRSVRRAASARRELDGDRTNCAADRPISATSRAK